jgi:hypothetical protein
LREPREASGWVLAKQSMETLYRAAGDSIIREERDSNEHVKMFVVERAIEDVREAGYEESEHLQTDKGQVWNGLLRTSGCLAKNNETRDIRFLRSLSSCGNTLARFIHEDPGNGVSSVRWVADRWLSGASWCGSTARSGWFSGLASCTDVATRHR